MEIRKRTWNSIRMDFKGIVSLCLVISTLQVFSQPLENTQTTKSSIGVNYSQAQFYDINGTSFSDVGAGVAKKIGIEYSYSFNKVLRTGFCVGAGAIFDYDLKTFLPTNSEVQTIEIFGALDFMNLWKNPNFLNTYWNPYLKIGYQWWRIPKISELDLKRTGVSNSYGVGVNIPLTVDFNLQIEGQFHFSFDKALLHSRSLKMGVSYNLEKIKLKKPTIFPIFKSRCAFDSAYVDSLVYLIDSIDLSFVELQETYMKMTIGNEKEYNDLKLFSDKMILDLTNSIDSLEWLIKTSNVNFTVIRLELERSKKELEIISNQLKLAQLQLAWANYKFFSHKGDEIIMRPTYPADSIIIEIQKETSFPLNFNYQQLDSITNNVAIVKRSEDDFAILIYLDPNNYSSLIEGLLKLYPKLEEL